MTRPPEPGPWSSGVAAPLIWDAGGPQEGDGDGSEVKVVFLSSLSSLSYTPIQASDTKATGSLF